MAEPSGPAKTPDKKPAKAASDTKKPENPKETKAESEVSVTPGDKQDADKKDAAKTDAKSDAKPDTKRDVKPESTGKSSSVPRGGSARPAHSLAKTENAGGGGRALLFLVVIVALLGGGAYATRGLWMAKVEPYLANIPGFGAPQNAPEQAAQPEKTAPPAPAASLSERLASLEKSFAESGNVDNVMSVLKEEKTRAQAELEKALTRIDDLETRLAEVRSLASAVTSNSGAEVDLAPILSRIDGLEKTERATSGEVAALAEKVESIAVKGAGAAGSGVVLAIAQVRDAALSGRPYAAQLSGLKSVAASSPDVLAAASRLEGGAETGLPTTDALQTSFSAIAGDIVVQSKVANGDWLEQASGRLSALVSLRRTDGSSGNPVEDAVAKIEQDLAARDMASVVKTADALSDMLQGAAKSTFEPWLLNAKARATAERALDAMHASALAALDR